MDHESVRHDNGGYNRITGLGTAIMQDLRYGLRFLASSPGFTAIAVLIMGLGIGANTAIFSILNSMMFRSLPYRNPSEVVRIYNPVKEGFDVGWISYPEFRDFSDRPDLFSEVALTSDGKLLSIINDEGTEPAVGEFCSAEFFSLLEFSPTLGRMFRTEENEAGSELVVMISYSLWQKKYGGDPEILGQSIRINGHHVTVVGVGPPNFTGTLKIFTTDYWMPLGTEAVVSPTNLESRDNRAFRMFARLKPGIGVEQARAQLSTIGANLAEEYPETNKDRRVMVYQADDVLLDPVVDRGLPLISLFLLIVVGLVLIVACSNLAGMLLMRASSRVKEVAIRLALGATRSRLMRQLLTESALLGILGGAAGLLIALWIASAFANIEVPLPAILTLDMRLDWRVLLYALVLSIATGILFGLAPALKASRRDLIRSIKDEAPTLGMERKYFTLRNFFVVTQVVVSIVLLISGGLVIRAIGRGQRIDPGFNTENTAVAAIDISLGGYEEEAPGRAFFERLSQRIASQPGVQTVALASRIPYGLWGDDLASRIRLPEQSPEENEELPIVHYAAVTSNYFDAMDISILQGRNFRNQDGPDSPRVVVVNETMAEQILGAANPIGRTIYLRRSGEEESAEVIGVARDTHMDLGSIRGESKPYFYRPFSQRYLELMIVVGRTSGSPNALPGIIRSELRELEPGIPVYEATTMTEHVRISFFVHRMTAYFLSCFGVLTMVLASIGLYGLVGYSVTQRTREVGIRIALGAERKQVVQMVMKQGIGLVFAGLVIGLPIGILLMKPLSNFLLGVPTYDFMTLAVVALILVAVAISASYIPARRAAKLDPMRALRYE